MIGYVLNCGKSALGIGLGFYVRINDSTQYSNGRGIYVNNLSIITVWRST